MRYHEQSVEGCYLPKVTGTYEAELFDVLRGLPQRGYRRIVNIGCDDGYDAVGLARLLPEATVWACDIDPRAIAATSALAQANGVADRIKVENYLFTPQDFVARASAGTLVVMDVEGVEE